MNKEILNYIPHRNIMALVQSIVNREKENFTIGISINKDSILSTEYGVPTYCGVEYMAQSIAVFDTMFYSEYNRVKIGFMVSIRNFKSSQEYFALGSQLLIKIEPILITENSGTFNCKIINDNQEISSAIITAYIPTKEELKKLKREENE
jgi:predicted hotdog family 3-hydroxylacyl-ACP dehydratase